MSRCFEFHTLFPDFFQPIERVLAAICQGQESTAKVALNEHLVEAFLAGPLASWEALVARAQAEKMGPLLLTRLQGTSPLVERLTKAWGPVPTALRKELAAAQRRTWIAATMRQQVLADLHRRFAAASLPYVAFKGMAYLQTLYTDLAQRPMEDMDLVVAEDRLDEAIAIVASFGFVRHDAKHPCAVLFRHPSGSMFLDLHFRISRPGLNHIDVKDVLNSVNSVDSVETSSSLASNTSVRPHVPGDVVQFLLHVNHQCKGQLTSGRVALLSFLEAAALYQRVKGQWDAVEALAARWKMRAFVDVGLWCVDALMPGVVAPSHHKRDLWRHWLTRNVRQPCTPEELNQPHKIFQRVLFLLGHIEGWDQRMKYLFQRFRYPLQIFARFSRRVGQA